MEKIKSENNEDYTFVKWEKFDEIISMLKEKRENIMSKGKTISNN